MVFFCLEPGPAELGDWVRGLGHAVHGRGGGGGGNLLPAGAAVAQERAVGEERGAVGEGRVLPARPRRHHAPQVLQPRLALVSVRIVALFLMNIVLGNEGHALKFVKFN